MAEKRVSFTFTFELCRTWPFSTPITSLKVLALRMLIALRALHCACFGITEVDFRSDPDFEST